MYTKLEKLQREHQALKQIPTVMLKAAQAEKVIDALVTVVIEQQQQIEELKKNVVPTADSSTAA